MPRVPVHTTADAPGQSQEALRGLERRMGRVLNIHAEMAHAPVVLAAYQGIQRAITKHGSFGAKTRGAIALAVAAADKCAYCQSAHTAGGQAAKWSLEETVAIRDGTAELDPKLAALLAVAREIAGSTGYVTDVTWQAALQAGWGDTELADCSPTWRRTCSPTTSTTTCRPSLTCPPRQGWKAGRRSADSTRPWPNPACQLPGSLYYGPATDSWPRRRSASIFAILTA